MAGRKIDVYSNGKRYSIIVAKNQKVIKIHRIQNSINFEANNKAQEELSISAYVLYMYLIKHEQGRVWALSSKDVYNKVHLTDRTYPKAVQELIDKDYLTKGTIDLGKYDRTYIEDAYHFWEYPALREKEEPIGKEIFKE